MSNRIHVAVFEDKSAFLRAAEDCNGSGLEVVDCMTPFPIHELNHVLGIKSCRLPWATLIGGLIGLALGLGFQYWSSATDWALDVGGKPWDSLPAFVPVGFEMTVLIAGLATVFGLFWRCGLRPGKKPRRLVPGVTSDRFALFVRHLSGSIEWRDMREVFDRHGAVDQWEEVS